MDPEVLAFLGAHPGRIALFERVEAAIGALGPSEYRVTKSQIAWKNPLNFAFLSRNPRVLSRQPEEALVLTLGLGRRGTEPCVKYASEPYPGRWTNHIILTRPEDVDETVQALLEEAYCFSREKGRRKKGNF